MTDANIVLCRCSRGDDMKCASGKRLRAKADYLKSVA